MLAARLPSSSSSLPSLVSAPSSRAPFRELLILALFPNCFSLQRREEGGAALSLIIFRANDTNAALTYELTPLTPPSPPLPSSPFQQTLGWTKELLSSGDPRGGRKKRHVCCEERKSSLSLPSSLSLASTVLSHPLSSLPSSPSIPSPLFLVSPPATLA